MTNLWPMTMLDLRTSMGGANARPLVIFLMVAAVAGLGSGAFAMPMAAAVAIAMSMSMSIFTADSIHRLSLLHGTLPVRRRTVMTSHYLVSFALFVATLVVVLGASSVGAVLRGDPLSQVWLAGLAMFGLLSLVFAVQIPIQVRYGLGAMRIMMLVIFGLVGLLVFGVAMMGEEAMRAMSGGVGEQALVWLPTLLALLGLVTWLVSYVVSARIYDRQDH